MKEAAKVALKKGETLSDWIPRLATLPLDFQPGTRWAYSAQAGFDTLARIVEITSGLPFDQFARQRIFDPLGMTRSTLTIEDNLKGPEPAVPYSERRDSKELYKQPYYTAEVAIAPAGAINSNVFQDDDFMLGAFSSDTVELSFGVSGSFAASALDFSGSPLSLFDSSVFATSAVAGCPMTVKWSLFGRLSLSKCLLVELGCPLSLRTFFA